uniref:Uncharacterized protein AlNc14C135G7061 n=1 Tax=Albugo laibachii Nc14 TaxID=890382 RepID=F0W6G8_9STRA|nr:conserved hypothetical protein [Albugo laibachii Nc14]CCA21818.1 conserved hypothetical protein [Albugo laibachii Nc14]|eukprot:CCA21818.1 conserved hypothetical protein [Albugo laibachii Nc14]
MTEVPGGLVRCVMQLRACSEKLRVSDEFLAAKLSQMREVLPLSSMPVLKSEIEFFTESKALPKPLNSATSFSKASEIGSRRVDELDSEKVALEFQISQRTEMFQDVLLRRNVGIQEEYKRSLCELDLELDGLNQAIEKKRRKYKRVRPSSSFKVNGVAQEKHRNLKETLLRMTERVQLLQEESTQLGLCDDEMAPIELNDAQKIELLEEKLSDVRKEVHLLKDTQESSMRSDSTNGSTNMEDEIELTQCLVRNVNTEIHSQHTRLLSLLRILAPTESIGSLMVRLYQQLAQLPKEIRDTSDPTTATRHTVKLREFLKVCGGITLTHVI